METSNAYCRRRRVPSWSKFALGVSAIYLIVAYLIMPLIDVVRCQQPDLAAGEHLTQTKTGRPGDPLNMALVGTQDEVIRSLLAAAWVPADALSFKSSMRIAVNTVIARPDPNAPVSNLYLFGRKQDLAFEKPIGHSPRQRHHVRFWRSTYMEAGRPVWVGSATHDTGVELSRTTGEVTHHIDGNVDAERDMMLDDLGKAHPGLVTRWFTGFHQIRQGRNGGGDPWYTDGRVPMTTLTPVTGS